MKQKYTISAVIIRITLFVAVISLTAGTLVQPVHAAALVDSMSLTNQIKSYKLYYAMSDCVNNASLALPLNDAVAATGNWYANHTEITGMVTDPDNPPDGRMECNNIVNMSLSLWGYTQKVDAIKAMGFVKKGGNWTKNSNPRAAMLSNIRSVAYGGKNPSYGSGFNYYDLVTSFTAGCSAKVIGNGPITNDQKALGYVEIVTVDQSGASPVTKNVVYSYSSGTLDYGAAPLAGSDEKLECRTIASSLSGAAGTTAANDYINYLHTLPPGTPLPGDPLNGSNVSGTGTTTCAIGGVGWLVCPVMTFLGGITDKAYGFLSDNFLTVDTSLINTTMTDPTTNQQVASPIYLAWQTFRNLANIAFVIVFLIIIYSQLTSAGINNYGIKKMLPKLIIAAILVNVSFYICQLAVDVSNLLGYGMKSLFDSLGSGSGITSDAGTAQKIGEGLTWAVLITGVLAVTVGLALAISLPVLLAALLALVAIVFILLARKALIVLLIVVSPLAFVAYLLPNTEQWYKKWQKLFFSLLMLFPTIGVLFGASRLAANIIASTGATATGSGDKWVIQATAMGIASIPLIFTYSLLKNALSATGAVGAKLSGLSSSANKNLSNKVKTTSRLGQGVSEAMNFRKQQRNINMAKNRGRGGRVNAAFGKLGGDGYAERMKTQGAALEDKEAEEAVANAVTQMKSTLGPAGILEVTKDKDGKTVPDIEKGAAAELTQALHDGDVAKTRAATKLLLGQGAPGKAALRAVMSSHGKLEKSPAIDGYQIEINAANLKGSDNVLASSGYTLGKTVEEIAGDTDTYNGLSDGELVGQNAGDIRRAVDLRAIDGTTAKRILENPSLQPSLTGAKRAALNLAFGGSGAGPTPPPAPSAPSGPPTPPSAPTAPGPSLNVPHGEEDDSAGVL